MLDARRRRVSTSGGKPSPDGSHPHGALDENAKDCKGEDQTKAKHLVDQFRLEYKTIRSGTCMDDRAQIAANFNNPRSSTTILITI
ncbi:hypothetical protein N8T08_004820 [Aspergillus melleus]|uniref:Uncharacterized protein n=1 Tax=Aspergillus melleus TaxID=138277 RepID=A0ACC3B3Q0_9EURO|nr:hypothetical protein N8T08_004820 [Aspergillus melleus]